VRIPSEKFGRKPTHCSARGTARAITPGRNAPIPRSFHLASASL